MVDYQTLAAEIIADSNLSDIEKLQRLNSLPGAGEIDPEYTYTSNEVDPMGSVTVARPQTARGTGYVSPFGVTSPLLQPELDRLENERRNEMAGIVLAGNQTVPKVYVGDPLGQPTDRSYWENASNPNNPMLNVVGRESPMPRTQRDIGRVLNRSMRQQAWDMIRPEAMSTTPPDTFQPQRTELGMGRILANPMGVPTPPPPEAAPPGPAPVRGVTGGKRSRTTTRSLDGDIIEQGSDPDGSFWNLVEAADGTRTRQYTSGPMASTTTKVETPVVETPSLRFIQTKMVDGVAINVFQREDGTTFEEPVGGTPINQTPTPTSEPESESTGSGTRAVPEPAKKGKVIPSVPDWLTQSDSNKAAWDQLQAEAGLTPEERALLEEESAKQEYTPIPDQTLPSTTYPSTPGEPLVFGKRQSNYDEYPGNLTWEGGDIVPSYDAASGSMTGNATLDEFAQSFGYDPQETAARLLSKEGLIVQNKDGSVTKYTMELGSDGKYSIRQYTPRYKTARESVRESIGNLSSAKAAALPYQQAADMEIAEQARSQYTDTVAAIQTIRERSAKLADAKVDPQRWVKNASIGQKLGSMAYMFAMGMMGGVQGIKLASDEINALIQRDIDLQLENIKTQKDYIAFLKDDVVNIDTMYKTREAAIMAKHAIGLQKMIDNIVRYGGDRAAVDPAIAQLELERDQLLLQADGLEKRAQADVYGIPEAPKYIGGGGKPKPMDYGDKNNLPVLVDGVLIPLSVANEYGYSTAGSGGKKSPREMFGGSNQLLGNIVPQLRQAAKTKNMNISINDPEWRSLLEQAAGILQYGASDSDALVAKNILGNTAYDVNVLIGILENAAKNLKDYGRNNLTIPPEVTDYFRQNPMNILGREQSTRTPVATTGK